MAFRDVQNPGIGGIDELTDAEALFVQNLSGLSYAQGDILYHNGTNLTRLAAGTSGHFLKTQGSGANPAWAAATVAITGTDTHVTFFDGANNPAGDAGFTYNKTTDFATLVGGLTAPRLYGSAASGGGLLINSTSHATKGSVSIGSATTGFIYDEVTNRVVVGDTETAITVGGSSIAAKFSVHTEGDSANVAMLLERHSTTAAFGAKIYGVRSKGDETTPLVVASGDNLFDLVALGFDGTDYEEAARIHFEVDGTPGAGDMPGRIVFKVSPDSSATPAEAMRISQDKTVRLASLTASELVASDASKNLVSLAVATYPSLTELTYVKGVTSAIQTQLGTKVTTGGALGTPSSGTLTNCTGLPVAGITASTTTALGVGSIELGHATDTTIARSAAGAITVEGVQVILSGAALGTPSSGTLTNCTGLPVAGITASTTTALGVGSIELGHATDTTIARVSAGVVSIEGVNILTTAGGTLTGNIVLGEGVDPATIGIVMDNSISADERYSGITVAGTAGATLAFGDLCYLDVTATEWLLADADAASTSGDVPLGICVDASTDGAATSMLLIGTVRSAAFPPSIALGAPVYVSTTAGDVQATQPSGVDDVIRRVGWAITAEPNTIYFNPSNDYTTHT